MTADERHALRVEIDRRRRHRLALSTKAPSSLATLAGHANLERLREAYHRLHVATAADACREAGVNRGAASYATRALAQEGFIVATGRRVRGSPEYRLSVP